MSVFLLHRQMETKILFNVYKETFSLYILFYEFKINKHIERMTKNPKRVTCSCLASFKSLGEKHSEYHITR